MEFPCTFGKYTLLKRLATGGMAEIFLARQRGMGGFEKEVVVKRLLPTQAQNQELVEMFLDEARIAANLTHPNIAQIFDLGQSGDDYFIAMEYVHGVDLRRLCQQGIAEDDYLPLQHAVRIMAQVCDALAYAHSRTDADGRAMDIVHRDVTPTNVLITYEGSVKLVDFGIAKAANKATVTRAGQVKGKMGYMAPEQARGEEPDARTDLFAVGINLYEITLGRRLFRGETEVDTLEAIQDADVPPPRSVNPSYPETLEKIVMKALARDPDERFANARDMQMALEDFLAEAGLRSTAGMLAEYMKRLFREQLELDAREGLRLRDLAQQSAERKEADVSDDPKRGDEASGEREVGQMEQWGAINAVPETADGDEKPIPNLAPPAVTLDDEDLIIRKPRSYTGLLLLLLISCGVFALYHVMQEDFTSDKQRGNPNIQVAAPSFQDLAPTGGELPPPAPPKKVLLRVESEPPGARVVVNGNLLAGLTPTAVQSFAGEWADVRVLLPGYLPADRRVQLSEAPSTEKFALEKGTPPTGSLRVETAPAGATISLNGTDVGDTPLELPAVAAGTPLTLRVVKDGYYPHIVQYSVPEGLKGLVGVRLVPEAGERTMAVVNIESIPTRAQVFEIGDEGSEPELVGRTSKYPVKINARMESHLRVRAEAPEHEPVEAFVDVRDPFYTLYLRLPAPEKFFGSLSIIGARGVTVYVDGEELGPTPIEKKALTEGEHEVVLVDPETNRRNEFKVEVQRNQTVEKSVVLTPEDFTVN